MKSKICATHEPQKKGFLATQKEAVIGGSATIKDNREVTTVQRQLKSRIENGEVGKTPLQKKTNRTGLPDTLKSVIENLSGYSMDDVKVHYNSGKPAQLQAHAYAQGTDIHLAPGQEKHLPHEAWHVVQQKQGRVKPTMQFKGRVYINDDAGLEKEADVMGSKCLRAAGNTAMHQNRDFGNTLKTVPTNRVVQKKDIFASMQNGKIGSIYEDWGRLRLTHKGGPGKKKEVNSEIFRFQIDIQKFEKSFGESGYPDNDKLRDFFKEEELKEHIEKGTEAPDWAVPITSENEVLENEDANFKLYELYYENGNYMGDHTSRGAMVKVLFDEGDYDIIEKSVLYAEDQVRRFKSRFTKMDESFRRFAKENFYDGNDHSNLLEGWIGNKAFLDQLERQGMYFFLIDYFRTNEEIYGKELHEKLTSFVTKVENANVVDVFSENL